MSSLKYSTVFIYAVFIIEAASGQTVDKIGVIGGTASFRPASLTLPVSSIVWKHKNSDGVIVKAIEWDVDEPKVSIPHPRFKNITTLDEKTGNITITSLNAGHAGTYILEINSKEQGQKFKLEVLAPVPKPEIIIVPIKDVSDTVYLECRYSDTIIWKNSAGETLKGTEIQKGESITVEKKGKPENSYTCTLKNTVSESTSDPVYKSDLFKPSSGSKAGLIAGLVIFFIIILLIIACIAVYLRKKSFRSRVNTSCPCIGSALSSVNCLKKQGKETQLSDQNNAERNPGPDTTKKEPDNEKDSLLEEKGHGKAAEDQKTSRWNQDSDMSENVTYEQILCVEGAELPRSMRAGESNDEAAEDKNNAERNPGPDTTKKEPDNEQI